MVIYEALYVIYNLYFIGYGIPIKLILLALTFIVLKGSLFLIYI